LFLSPIILRIICKNKEFFVSLHRQYQTIYYINKEHEEDCIDDCSSADALHSRRWRSGIPEETETEGPVGCQWYIQ